MTTKERMTRIYDHQPADRVPIVDSPWAGTLSRWRREGLPDGMDWRDYLGVDKVEEVSADISPRYEYRVLEETDRYIIYTSSYGVTMKQFKEEDSTPAFLDYTVTTPETWQAAKARMTVSRDRVNWALLEQHYSLWVKEGRWIQAGFWFGFDVTHSWMSGTETILIAMIEDPEWCQDMFNTYLDSCIAHFNMMLDAGYRFDCMSWCDDMGYKNTPFFSRQVYRTVLQPVHKRAVDWAHSKGMRARLHSCGDIMPLIPDILETGIDALNPIEVKAGMDIFRLKREYGDRCVLNGGIDAQRMNDAEQTIETMRAILPVVKENGGYIFSSDHSIPNSVSLQTYQAIVEAAKVFGAY